jgi:hypothetical protein
MYRVSQVLPPDRKHLLLIDLKFSKNSGMIVYRRKNFNFFNEIGKYVCSFNSITATLIYRKSFQTFRKNLVSLKS